MKLAEALAERADLQKRMAQMRDRLSLNSRVQDGEKPSEDPNELLLELDAMTARLETLIAAINRTNSEKGDGKNTITELLAKRDCLAQKSDILRGFLDCASETVMRGMRSEIVIRSTVPVAELRKKVDALSKELRETDTCIQSLNWTVELL